MIRNKPKALHLIVLTGRLSQLRLSNVALVSSFQMADKQLLPRGYCTLFVNAFYAPQAANGTHWD